MGAEARQGLQPPGRAPGAMGSVGPAGSRSPRPEVAPRGDDQPPTVGEGGAAAVAEEVRTAVPEACDAPVVEAEEAGGAEQVGGAQLEGGPSPEACAAPIQWEDEVEEHALLNPSALEAFLRGQEVGGSHMVQRDALGRDLNPLELEALDRGLERPERVVSQGDVAFLSDGEGWPTLRISAGTFSIHNDIRSRGSGKSNSSNIGGNNNNNNNNNNSNSGEGSSGGKKSNHRGSSSINNNNNNKDNKSSSNSSGDGSNISSGNNDSNSSSSNNNSGLMSIGDSHP
ncbi:hypothetical protein CYMTET_39438 [Cymbomonas tetramitiformis]|uniref:Uncharacterized protein n=1 Tax=Cymbomonas tetramitiformis TaxID=36881 RepID=A0AAE0F5L3_9CHLO|nr:hypothetical protein CYMTET_39438 [Cymbomonas tetramitiformis]